VGAITQRRLPKQLIRKQAIRVAAFLRDEDQGVLILTP